ncbi:MAG: PAS domain-containing sensor histidine kinase [Romboutsia sp.]
MESVYKKMIQDSPIAYMCMNAIKGVDGEYKKIEMLESNNSFNNLFEIYIENKDIGNADLSCHNEKWKEVLIKAKQNNKHIIRRYMNELHIYLNIEVYYVENEKFVVRFMEIDEEYMKLSSMLRETTFRVWIKDRSGKYIDINNKFLNDIKLTYDELIGQDDIEIFGYEVGNKYIEEDNVVMKENKTITYEENSRIIENDNKYFHVTKWPYTDKNKNILGTVGIGVEITDKIELRNNIIKNEQNFLDIAECIEEALFIRDKNKTLYVSPSWEKLVGESPDKMLENPNRWTEYFLEEDIQESKQCEFDKNCNSVLRTKSDTNKYLWCKAVPIKDENGIVVKKVGIITDISKRLEIEKEVEQLRMDFFTNLSHDLRTPINLILSCIQVLNLRIDKLEKDNFEYYSKYLGIVSQNGLRLLKLVNNLIDISKIDKAHISYCPQNYDVVKFIEDICMSVSQFIESKNISLVFDTNVEEKIIGFDLDHMERIILNLISNAIKFNKTNGIIYVNIYCEDNIKIIIKDNGIGIPKDKLNSVFNRFEQANSKTEREGSGIGLSLVKLFVEMHGGSINVNSQLGVGSEFIITLPDMLVDSNEVKQVDLSNNMGNIGRMNIEFSDIYT